VLERAIRLVAIVSSLLVVLGWGWFAATQTSTASKDTQAEIAGQVVPVAATVSPGPDQERAREQVDSKAHEVVDDANDVLLSPFASIASGSSSEWLRRTVPALLALLVYGFGLGLLARFAAGRGPGH
jgi:hypothetical protein